VVLFNNQSLNQANVYAVRSGGPQVRIGSVIANRARDAARAVVDHARPLRCDDRRAKCSLESNVEVGPYSARPR
jgi:hypothetical protein